MTIYTSPLGGGAGWRMQILGSAIRVDSRLGWQRRLIGGRGGFVQPIARRSLLSVKSIRFDCGLDQRCCSRDKWEAVLTPVRGDALQMRLLRAETLL